jgi:hypothetical protein
VQVASMVTHVDIGGGLCVLMAKNLTCNRTTLAFDSTCAMCKILLLATWGCVAQGFVYQSSNGHPVVIGNVNVRGMRALHRQGCTGQKAVAHMHAGPALSCMPYHWYDHAIVRAVMGKTVSILTVSSAVMTSMCLLLAARWAGVFPPSSWASVCEPYLRPNAQSFTLNGCCGCDIAGSVQHQSAARALLQGQLKHEACSTQPCRTMPYQNAANHSLEQHQHCISVSVCTGIV